MYLTLTNVVKNIFTSSSHAGGKKTPESPSSEDHVYIRGDIVDRGPCPGLNALANQGFLY